MKTRPGKVFEVLSLGALLSIEIFIWTLNVDALIVGFNAFSVPPLAQLYRVGPLVIFGGSYSYWFWGYMDRNSHGLKMLALVNWLANRLPKSGSGFVRMTEGYALGLYHRALSFNRTRTRKMFVIGAFPLPGVRTVSGVYCGLTHWWQGMLMLLLGDLTKTAVEVGFVRLLKEGVVWLWFWATHR